MRKLIVFLMLSLGFSAYAQQRSVSGTVKDQNGQPVVGLTVLEQGTGNGVTTDQDGRYDIKVSSSESVLEFASLGYSTVNEKVGGRSVVNVTVKEEAIALDAVVAIGYGTVRKKDLTTAVSTVSTEDISLRPVPTVSGFIQGKVAGVTVQQTSGTPGGGMTVRVRGNSSITSGNDPLYVVDGVPVGTGNGAITYLSPNDIETMQILKDASSAAIYGSRAANGVVLITTKKGSKDVGPQINFTSYVGLGKVSKTFDVLNVAQYKDLMDEIGAVKLPDGLKDETDWFKETYRTAVSQNYQLSVSNANDRTRYYIGAGYVDQEGIIRTSYYKRYNFRASVDSDLFKWINVGADVTFSHWKQNGIISGTGSNRAGVVMSVINTPTYAKVWDEENPDHYWTKFYGANVTTPAENIARQENFYDQNDRLILTGHAMVKFSKNLNFKSTVTMDRTWTFNYQFLDPIKTAEGRTQHGLANTTRADNRVMVLDNILTYKNQFGKHSLEAMAGTSATLSHWENLTGSRQFFSPDYDNILYGLNGGNSSGLRGNSQGLSEWSIMSYLGRISYNFDSRYYLTVNMRADGSSKLAPGHRWGYFPSASIAWRVSGEEFMQDIDWINDLKIRAGWGQQGNQGGLGDHAWVQNYATIYYDWTKPENAQATPSLGAKTNIGNRDLTWETTTQSNVGVDLSVLNSRLNFTLDGYYKYTTNLLLNVPLPAPYSNITRNEGEMSNWGLEFAVSSVNIDRNGFRWNTDFNISMNRNRLEKLTLQQVYNYIKPSDIQSEYIVRMTPGKPLSQFWGYKSDGVDPETGLMIYEDLDGNGKITDSDKTWIGDPNPDFTFGMTNNLHYKGFNLSFLITGSVGNDIYNASRVDMEGMVNGYNQTTAVLRRWRIPGQITDIPKSNEMYNVKVSSRWIENGSYLKVKNITLSYDFAGPKLKRLNITRIRPYVTLDNMITFTKYSGYDPEMSQWASATNFGIDWGTYPCVRTVTFGVNVDF